MNINLVSSDNISFLVSEDIAKRIEYVSLMLEDIQVEDGMDVPVGKISGHILAKIVDYCTFHHNRQLRDGSKKEIEIWEKSFLEVDVKTLFQIIAAADFLAMQPLIDLVSRRIANMISAMPSDQIRLEFSMRDDTLKNTKQ